MGRPDRRTPEPKRRARGRQDRPRHSLTAPPKTMQEPHAVTATPPHLDQARVPTPNRSVVRAGGLLRRHSGLLASAGLVVTWSSGFVGAELGTRAGAAPLTGLGWGFMLLTAVLLTVCVTNGTSLRS